MSFKGIWYFLVYVFASLVCVAPVCAQNTGMATAHLTEEEHRKIQEQFRPDIKFGALTPKLDTRVFPSASEQRAPAPSSVSHAATPAPYAHSSIDYAQKAVNFPHTESASAATVNSASVPIRRSLEFNSKPQEPPKMAVAPPIRFRARITSQVDGRIAKAGDIVSGELLDTIVLPGGTMVGAGSPIIGEITEVQRSKKPLKADTSIHRWHDANGQISMHITKVCGRDMIVDIIPCPKTRVERGNKKSLALGVDAKGDIVFRYSMAKYNATNLAISGVGIAAGPVGWIVGPVLGGAAGATEPVLTYGRPITEKDAHPRINGMVKGIVGGLPGGYFISGAINHGLDPALDVGDVVTFEERSRLNM